VNRPIEAQSASQDQIFAFLANPVTHAGEPVRRIDTHVAAVFLVGAKAFKVKRAVRFPFLDFSSLAQRKAACEAEIEANRPFAPELYCRVIAITREPDGTLALAGSGEPVEWAVEMNRFDESKTLDRVADAGGIDLALADQLAHAVASAHAKATVVDATSWIAAFATYIEQNDAELCARPALFTSDAVASLTQKCRIAFDKVRPLLVERGARGLIRRGHGDLHLGNIALIDGRPVPFDALEFDPIVASGDVFYDLAFLLMDLIERGMAAAANVVLNRYLAETRRLDDLDALAALPLFMSVRAAIRAKVTAARTDHATTSERQAIAAMAQAYFAIAVKLIDPPAPSLIAIGGLSGTGKSVLARALAPSIAPLPGAIVLRSDIERKALFGALETARLDASAYSTEVNTQVYEALNARARRILQAGHSAIADAVFAQPRERTAIATAAEPSVAFHGLFLTASLATRATRVGRRTDDASDADAKVAQAQSAYDLGEMNWIEIDASGTPERTLAHASTAIGAMRAERGKKI
jgi:uncharacterized protein